MTEENFYQMQVNQSDLFLLAVPGYSSKNSCCLVKCVATFHGDDFTKPLPKLVWSKRERKHLFPREKLSVSFFVEAFTVKVHPVKIKQLLVRHTHVNLFSSSPELPPGHRHLLWLSKAASSRRFHKCQPISIFPRLKML